MNCIFCDINEEDIISNNKLAFAIYDKFPVNRGHILVIPKRHFSSLFDATEDEILEIYRLVEECKKILDKKLNPNGYNVGINIGEDAGQSIFHLHVHLIPRYIGDVEEDRLKGGIRNFKEAVVRY